MRFALAQSMGVLLRILPPTLLARFTKKTLLLDAEARDDGLYAAAPEGSEVVVASATPVPAGDQPYGPTFDPAHPPFPPRTFHAVLAGPCLLPRTGAERERAFKGLLSLARGVLVLALPATGSLGELGAEAAAELATRRLGAEHPWTRTLAAGSGCEGPSPGELEDLAGLERAALLYLPAYDPVGAAGLAMFRAFVLGLPEGDRLAGLVDRFFNTALTEAGPTLGSRYHDLALVFPGRRSVPGAVAARAAEDRSLAAKAGRTDVAALQLALELDALDRKLPASVPAPAPAPAQSAALAPRDGIGAAELARWSEILEEMGRKVERMAKDAEAATGRAVEGTGRMQQRLEAALATVAQVQEASRAADGLRGELEGERTRSRQVAREADEAKGALGAARRELEVLGREIAKEQEAVRGARAGAERAEAARRLEAEARARAEEERTKALAKLEAEATRAGRAEAAAAQAVARIQALEAELAAVGGEGGKASAQLAGLEAELDRSRQELASVRTEAARRAAEAAALEAARAGLAADAERLGRELETRGAELAEARLALEAASPRLAEAEAKVLEADRRCGEAEAARLALEARVAELKASYDGLAAEIDEFRRVVSSNPLLKAYIVAKGARLPGSPAAATAAPGRAV